MGSGSGFWVHILGLRVHIMGFHLFSLDLAARVMAAATEPGGGGGGGGGGCGDDGGGDASGGGSDRDFSNLRID